MPSKTSKINGTKPCRSEIIAQVSMWHATRNGSRGLSLLVVSFVMVLKSSPFTCSSVPFLPIGPLRQPSILAFFGRSGASCNTISRPGYAQSSDQKVAERGPSSGRGVCVGLAAPLDGKVQRIGNMPAESSTTTVSSTTGEAFVTFPCCPDPPVTAP